MAEKSNISVAEFDLSAFEAADEAGMAVVVNGKVSEWIWTFAGPGHPKTVEQASQAARERLHQDRMKEQAIVNGKKWKAPEESVDDVRARNVNWIIGRLLGWSPVKIDGEMLPYSDEAARKLLSDPRKGELFTQALEFLASDTSFTQRSATT